MADLRQAQRRMFTAAGVLGLLAVAAVAFLVSPLGRSRAAYEQEFTGLRPELHKAVAEARDAENIDQKLVTAQKQITNVYEERFAARWSDIAAEIGEIADDAGVTVGQLRYDARAEEAPGLERVEMQASVTGSYLEIVKFINALERDKMMFVVDSITLGSEREGAVQLELALVTYMRRT
jgi:type IV pilus assembly protein PilO